MRVVIKKDQSIPAGYTLIDCNTYTPEEFIRACSPAIKGCVNQNAVDYVQEHRRASYDTEDLYRVRMMRPAMRNVASKKPGKNARRAPRIMRDPVRTGDMSMQEMAEHCGVNVSSLDHCVRELGMPHRWGMNPVARRETKYLRPEEVLQFLEQLPRRSEKHNIIIRRLRQDLKGA